MADEHEVLTDEMMESFVRDHFHVSHPEIEAIYFQVKDYILRSDLIRYLILLADGGVYNDLDVACVKPISTWVPKQYEDSAGVVLGVEVDNKFGPDGRTFTNGVDLFQLVNWTIMSKPNQPFMCFLVKRVIHNIKTLAESQQKSVSDMIYTIQDVLDSTGPAALTKAFFDYASDITGSNVTYHNFTKMREPRLIGEVVILPIQAFGAGHQVEWAGWKQDGTELIHHYFAGSWKSDHVDAPVHLEADEGKKHKDEEKKKQEEKERQEEEKKAQDAKAAQMVEDDQKIAAEKKKTDQKKIEDWQQAHKDTVDSTDTGTGNKEDEPTARSPNTTADKDESVEETGTDTVVETVEDVPGASEVAETARAQEQTLEESAEAKAKAEKEAKFKEDQKAASVTKLTAEAKAKAANARKKAEEEKEKAKERVEAETKPDPKWASPKEVGETKASTDLADYGSDDLGDVG
ncbi:hypothetical protein P7C71_g1406, partial [Lecanoromycetidae sp. Uapishka_2]